jgi:hypothetical protein
MNHKKQYELLINKTKTRVLDNKVYTEKHHILPKSLGGSNSLSNIVVLTGREHFIAHMLLAHIYGKGMWQAAIMMKHSPNNVRKINSRLYQIAKTNWSIYQTGKKRENSVGEAISKAKLGKKLSDETKQKMSLVRKGKPRAGDPEKWKHSDESKKKMSISQKNAGNRLPIMRGEDNPMKRPEIRAKISAAKKLYWEKKRMENQYIQI